MIDLQVMMDKFWCVFMSHSVDVRYIFLSWLHQRRY